MEEVHYSTLKNITLFYRCLPQSTVKLFNIDESLLLSDRVLQQIDCENTIN